MTCTRAPRLDEIAIASYVDKTASAGLNQPIDRRTMRKPDAPPQATSSGPVAGAAGQDMHASSASSTGGWDFGALGAFLRTNDAAWVRSASARRGPSLPSALSCPSCDPDSSAEAI